jgi:hypothetical protein
LKELTGGLKGIYRDSSMVFPGLFDCVACFQSNDIAMVFAKIDSVYYVKSGKTFQLKNLSTSGLQPIISSVNSKEIQKDNYETKNSFVKYKVHSLVGTAQNHLIAIIQVWDSTRILWRIQEYNTTGFLVHEKILDRSVFDFNTKAVCFSKDTGLLIAICIKDEKMYYALLDF